jgi:DnaJ like chaperone protein
VILGVDKSLTDKELKRAYRRLLAQHHPDKLVSKGLPEEMIKIANEKTQKIISSYELIKKHRGMR